MNVMGSNLFKGTMNGESYLNMLQDKYMSHLDENGGKP